MPGGPLTYYLLRVGYQLKLNRIAHLSTAVEAYLILFYWG
jgi:hypothetical protein